MKEGMVTRFAREKHKGQLRKFEGENVPYVVHPTRVSMLVWRLTKDRTLTTASILHDTIEDTKTKKKEIEKLFGEEVADLVVELTSSRKEVRRHGKKEYLARKMAHDMSDDALIIKLADRYDNVAKLDTAPENFQEKYSTETEYILERLDKERSLNSTHKKIIDMIKSHI